MENLNKENFWNSIKERYPEAFAKFSKWIDYYKFQNNWEKIFNANADDDGRATKAPKFHDIPFEFQHGVIARFDIETRYKKSGYEKMKETYIKEVEGMFYHLEQEINATKPTN